ncbi:MAG: hypothetical protein NT045_04235 [Candidatus Aureabacteria bacterium]|nr:hypothetical protein [Candidatus Auribacterota bacterium]
MIAFTVLFFLLLVSVMTAVAIMAAMKTVDFFDATRRFYQRMEGLEAKLDEIIRRIDATQGRR